jgi:hypothetical protein
MAAKINFFIFSPLQKFLKVLAQFLRTDVYVSGLLPIDVRSLSYPSPSCLLPSEISKKFRGPSPGNPSDFSGHLIILSPVPEFCCFGPAAGDPFALFYFRCLYMRLISSKIK